MLSKKERLNREDFNRFFAIGRRFQGPSLTLIHSPHNQFHGSVVVSKKIMKTAVSRNKLRRRVYDVLRTHARAQNLKGVFIFIAKPQIKELTTYTLLQSEIRMLIGRTSISR